MSTHFSFDTIIVFGEGPIKPILLANQLTPLQQQQIEVFKQDPLKNAEPDFWFMQQPRALAQLIKIEQNELLSKKQKALARQEVFTQWQHTGWFALKRMGRQNALATGLALYQGIAKEAILSGGRTISSWAKKLLSSEQLENWPSEAELMADIIKNSYGDLYKKKYGHSIKDVLIIEDAATNTLENFAYSVNKYPELLLQEKKVGVLSARHHLKRLRLLAQIFGISIDEHSVLPSQELLRIGDTTAEIIIDERNCADTKKQQGREEQWMKALLDPQYVTYWLGYVAEVKNYKVLQKTMERLCEVTWKKAAVDACTKVGINLDEFTGEDLSRLAKENPVRYTTFISALQELKNPKHRIIPS